MDADAHRTGGIDRDGKGVVDFGGLGVVDGKRGHVGQRQLADFGRRRTGGEVRAARKVFEEETAEVILVAVSDGAAGTQQFDGRLATLAASCFQRLGFRAITVRAID